MTPLRTAFPCWRFRNTFRPPLSGCERSFIVRHDRDPGRARHLCRFPGSQWSESLQPGPITFLLVTACLSGPLPLPFFCSSRIRLRPPGQPQPFQIRRPGVPSHLRPFLQEEGYRSISAFFLLYRLRSPNSSRSSLFSARPRHQGDWELTTTEVGVIYGTVGVIALMLGVSRWYAIYKKRAHVLDLDHGCVMHLRISPSSIFRRSCLIISI